MLLADWRSKFTGVRAAVTTGISDIRLAQPFGPRVLEGCFHRLPGKGRFSEALAGPAETGDPGPGEGFLAPGDSAAVEAVEEEPAGSGNLLFVQ